MSIKEQIENIDNGEIKYSIIKELKEKGVITQKQIDKEEKVKKYQEEKLKADKIILGIIEEKNKPNIPLDVSIQDNELIDEVEKMELQSPIKRTKKIIVPVEPEIVAPENNVIDTLKQIFQEGNANQGMSDDDVKDIENIKLIISAILNDELLESLTNLDPDELDDINDAFYLNEYFDNPRIDLFIMHRLKLSRSKVVDGKANNLLEIFADISGKGMKSLTDIGNNSILGNRFKK